eukprot:scaffold20056_cov33-Tisochrysis_lutea.AAC.2
MAILLPRRSISRSFSALKKVGERAIRSALSLIVLAGEGQLRALGGASGRWRARAGAGAKDLTA